jgi:hypothetical protein
MGAPFVDADPTPDSVLQVVFERVLEAVLADGAGGADAFRLGGVFVLGWEEEFGVFAGAGR